ncbi:DUF2200 domain-containing protein [Companilactobacillus nuruki]|uniref:DUF2200 domain-containing protein n=1 Tax=Companilactobacillus nuruki TaxID=1993540 RepID=A0A2N7AW70_9LACO|nr:DUF2200 domain-containing protein [Companilactobacillus nuruki]PMD72966.1 hypothetical protein CBP76_02190 [Companilactobacillus nuruki]
MKKKDISDMLFKDIYPLYIQKVERKGHTKSEVDEIIYWLTGYDETGLNEQLTKESTLTQFFNAEPHLNDNAKFIKGSICGIRVEEIKDPLVQKIRYLDKLIDELAHNKAIDKILRTS